MPSPFFFSLGSIKPQFNNQSGSLSYVTAKEAPGFFNISFSTLTLNPKGSLEPVWHPNAHKIGYCVEGQNTVFIRTPDSEEVFTVNKGDMFFIPKGYAHHIENVGNNKSVIHFALDHNQPETMFLSKAIYSLSKSVFNTTFNANPNFYDGLKKNGTEPIKTLPKQNAQVANGQNSYKFGIEKSRKVILNTGGYLQVGTKTTFPILQGLGILGFGLNQKGIVEPHWHTNAGELVFIVKGKTKITILSPNGNVETLNVNAGEGAFAPASHFHNIENVGSEEVEVIAFFSDAAPDYIGIAEVVGSYSNELLASVFNTTPEYFEALKKTEEPLVIVPV